MYKFTSAIDIQQCWVGCDIVFLCKLGSFSFLHIHLYTYEVLVIEVGYSIVGEHGAG